MRIKNQKGFETVEIILVMMIIAIVSAVALPNISRMIDVAQTDYETKKFVSEFYFARSVSKSSKVESEIFDGNISDGDDVIFSVSSRSYETKINWRFIRERHYLPKNFKITRNNISSTLIFSNGRVSSSGKYIVESPFGSSRTLTIDSVGRLHAERGENN